MEKRIKETKGKDVTYQIFPRARLVAHIWANQAHGEETGMFGSPRLMLRLHREPTCGWIVRGTVVFSTHQGSSPGARIYF